MKDKLDIIKKIKDRTLDSILSKYGGPSRDLTEMKLSIWDVRVELYKVCQEVAHDVINGEFTR